MVCLLSSNDTNDFREIDQADICYFRNERTTGASLTEVERNLQKMGIERKDIRQLEKEIGGHWVENGRNECGSRQLGKI